MNKIVAACCILSVLFIAGCSMGMTQQEKQQYCKDRGAVLDDAVCANPDTRVVRCIEGGHLVNITCNDVADIKQEE